MLAVVQAAHEHRRIGSERVGREPHAENGLAGVVVDPLVAVVVDEDSAALTLSEVAVADLYDADYSRCSRIASLDCAVGRGIFACRPEV